MSPRLRRSSSRNLAVTIDAGTGSVKVSIFDGDRLAQLAGAAEPYPVAHVAHDRAEWDPASWWQSIVAAIRRAVTQAGRPAGEYAGITVTSLRQGFVLLDGEGQAVAPGLLNYDRRGASYIQLIEAALPIEPLYRLTGHWHAPELTLPKLLWFMHEQPAVWARARRCLFVHDWIIYRLCGEAVTAPSMITAGQMGDCERRDWAQPLLADLGIDPRLLPPVLEGGQVAGSLLPAIAELTGLPAGLPVHVGGGDTQFACLGSGGMSAGRVVIAGGSTSPVMMTTAAPIFDSRRYPWVSPHLEPGLWAIETNAGQTGMIYRWFLGTFCAAQVSEARGQGLGDFEVLDRLAAQAPIGASGLLTIAASPRWAQDTWEHQAPYTFLNFSVAQTLGDVARSILEGACCGIRGNVEQLERIAGRRFDRLIFAGGSARVPFWAQMLANVLARPVDVPEVDEPAAAAGAHLVLNSGKSAPFVDPAYRTYAPATESSEQYEPVYQEYVRCFEVMHSTLV